MRIKYYHFILLISLLVASSCSSLSERKPISHTDSLKIAFGSCVKSSSSPIWLSILGKDPDLFLLLGDTVYQSTAHYGKVRKIRELYQQTYSSPEFRKLKSAVPIYAIWDDHDFGPNNSDSSFLGSRASLKAFKKHWTNPEQPAGLEGSIAFELDLGSVLILMTDNRSYRKNLGTSVSGQMFGDSQLKWLESRLRSSNARIIVLGSGTQLLAPRSSSESFADFPMEKIRLLKAIQASSSTVVLLSGDAHFAEIAGNSLDGKDLVEITSSPLTAMPEFMSKAQELGQRKVALGHQNFGILHLDLKSGKVSAEVYEKHGRLILESDS